MAHIPLLSTFSSLVLRMGMYIVVDVAERARRKKSKFYKVLCTKRVWYCREVCCLAHGCNDLAAIRSVQRKNYTTYSSSIVDSYIPILDIEARSAHWLSVPFGDHRLS